MRTIAPYSPVIAALGIRNVLGIVLSFLSFAPTQTPVVVGSVTCLRWTHADEGLRRPVRPARPRTPYAFCRIRQDVFVVEQQCPYPDLDGRDAEPGPGTCC